MAKKAKPKKSVRDRMIAKAQRRLANLARKRAKIRKAYRDTVSVINNEIAEQREVLRVVGARPGKARKK